MLRRRIGTAHLRETLASGLFTRRERPYGPCVTLESSSASSTGAHADSELPTPIGTGAALGRAVLVAAAISILYLLLAYGALRLSFEWFPPRDWRQDTDPTWVLPIAIYAPLVVAAAAVRIVSCRVTASIRRWHWAFAALLASLLLIAAWHRWVRGGATDPVQAALGVGMFFALIGSGLRLGGYCRASPLRSRGTR